MHARRPRLCQGGGGAGDAPGGVPVPAVQGDHPGRGGHDDAGRAVGPQAHDGDVLHGENRLRIMGAGTNEGITAIGKG